MKVARLYLGSMGSDPASTVPVHAYLLDHPEGAVLVDTGFGATVAGDSETCIGVLDYGGVELTWVRRTTIEALADHGVEAGDVRYVINTHLFDHAGDNHLFPEATFIVQRPEWEAWADSRYAPAWDFPGVDVELLEGADGEVLGGVRCLFTPGHTPGHQSVLVEADGERTLLVGDAAYSIGIWEDPASILGTREMRSQVGVPDGYEMWARSLQKLKDARADLVHFSHDSRILRSAPAPPSAPSST